MFFISLKKLLLEIFIFIFPFHIFQIQKEKCEWNNINDVMDWLALICRWNFWNNSKTALYYIIKTGPIIHN